MRSRQLLSGARELELKSALEATKQAVQRRDEAVRRLEDRVRELEERVRATAELRIHEEIRRIPRDDGTQKAKGDGRKNERKNETENVHIAADGTADAVDGKGGETGGAMVGSPKSSKSPNLAFLEANHPWLSPVLLRLERLSNESESEFKVAPNKRFSLSDGVDDAPGVEEGRFDVDLTLMEGEEDSMDAGSCAYRMDNIDVVNKQMEDVAYTADSGRYETPEPTACRFIPVIGLPSVREDDGGSLGGGRRECEGCCSALETPTAGSRSSMRRRKSINYALPSLNAKLRQGDAHTFV